MSLFFVTDHTVSTLSLKGRPAAKPHVLSEFYVRRLKSGDGGLSLVQALVAAPRDPRESHGT
jgi:hypothetical protein